jgi:hypothetical protein
MRVDKMRVDKSWVLAWAFLLLQMVVTVLHVHIGADSRWEWMGWAALVFLSVFVFNLALSLPLAALGALLVRNGRGYGMRFRRLVPVGICIASLVICLVWALG